MKVGQSLARFFFRTVIVAAMKTQFSTKGETTPPAQKRAALSIKATFAEETRRLRLELFFLLGRQLSLTSIRRDCDVAASRERPRRSGAPSANAPTSRARSHPGATRRDRRTRGR